MQPYATVQIKPVPHVFCIRELAGLDLLAETLTSPETGEQKVCNHCVAKLEITLDCWCLSFR